MFKLDSCLGGEKITLEARIMLERETRIGVRASDRGFQKLLESGIGLRF